ncbi:MAG: hypothetical protein JJLCMIEE_02513 [Acidimicrobiales bacterium]|nr:hypothetical protein [Acidimicrobiales bacterium]
MVAVDRDDLARRMADMVEDRTMVVPFVESYRDNLHAVVRTILLDFGRQDLLDDPDEVNGLVWDVALVIQERSHSWSSGGGALPWYWAARAIRSEVARLIGHAQAPLDIDSIEAARPALADAAAEADLDELALQYPVLGLLQEAIGMVASPRHAELHIEYQLQKCNGDPSPAQTVATMFATTPANVRQIDCRIRRRLRQLIYSDDRFAGLRGLEWFVLDQRQRSEPQPALS